MGFIIGDVIEYIEHGDPWTAVVTGHDGLYITFRSERGDNDDHPSAFKLIRTAREEFYRKHGRCSDPLSDGSCWRCGSIPAEPRTDAEIAGLRGEVAKPEPTEWVPLGIREIPGCRYVQCNNHKCPLSPGLCDGEERCYENTHEVRWPSGEVGKGEPEFRRVEPEAVATMARPVKKYGREFLELPSFETTDHSWAAADEGRRIVGEYGPNVHERGSIIGDILPCCSGSVPLGIVGLVRSGELACPLCGYDARRCQVGAERGHRCNELLMKRWDHQRGVEFLACECGHRSEG